MSTDYPELIRLAKKGKEAEQRGKAAAGCITHLLSSAANAFFGGWMLMLSVGIIHLHWLPELPTVGYWISVLVVALMRGVFSRMPQKSDKEKK